MDDRIKHAVSTLNQGGIVIFPTDTAFGIGCRIDDEKAIQRLFAIRKRPETQPTPVLVSSLEIAQEYLQTIPQDVIEKLIKPLWPGALTIVLSCKREKVPELVRGGSNSLGVRMPDHSTILQIIKQIGIPILGPSANFHGEKTPFNFEDLDQELLRKVDFVLNGECTIKQPSTVIDCSVKPWRILREGAIKLRVDPRLNPD